MVKETVYLRSYIIRSCRQNKEEQYTSKLQQKGQTTQQNLMESRSRTQKMVNKMLTSTIRLEMVMWYPLRSSIRRSAMAWKVLEPNVTSRMRFCTVNTCGNREKIRCKHRNKGRAATNRQRLRLLRWHTLQKKIDSTTLMCVKTNATNIVPGGAVPDGCEWTLWNSPPSPNSH